MIDAIATVDEPGKVWAIALVNRHPSKNAACTVKMKDALLDGRYEATILAGDSPEAFNDVEHPSRVAPERTQLSFEKGVVTLPPHSLAIIRVHRK
jgi:alpha-N-arabinofuranosidase